MTIAPDSKIAANGRPADYTAEIGMTICERLVEGESLGAICVDAGMPEKTTVLRWLADHKEFRAQYAFARAAPVHDLGDETSEIADDRSADQVEKVRADGRVAVVRNPEHLARCRLRIEIRQWVATRLLPKDYGEILEKVEGYPL